MIAIQQFEVAQRFAMGCRPKALPRWPPRVHPQGTVEQATILTGTVNIQSPKGPLFALGGLALLAASCKSQEWPALIYLGVPSFSTIPLVEVHHEPFASTRSSL